jgi:hypothetical protein
MARYHVNPENGNVGVCKAQISCPLGATAAHGSTVEEAARTYENQMANDPSINSFGTVSKKSPIDDSRSPSIDNWGSLSMKEKGQVNSAIKALDINDFYGNPIYAENMHSEDKKKVQDYLDQQFTEGPNSLPSANKAGYSWDDDGALGKRFRREDGTIIEITRRVIEPEVGQEDVYITEAIAINPDGTIGQQRYAFSDKEYPQWEAVDKNS